MKKMKRQAGSVMLGLLLALAVSVLANAALWRAMGKEHDKSTKLGEQLTQANTATRTCNDSIAGLEAEAKQRGIAAEKARAAAAERRKKANRQADTELSTPATIPGDDCKSAQDRVNRILKARTP